MNLEMGTACLQFCATVISIRPEEARTFTERLHYGPYQILVVVLTPYNTNVLLPIISVCNYGTCNIDFVEIVCR